MKKIMKTLLTAGVLSVMVFAMGIMVSAAETPGKVTGVKQTDAYSNSVDISWDAQLMDCYYETEISQDKKTWNLVSEYRSSPTDYIYNLSRGKTYYVRVRALTTGSNPVYGPYSDPVAVVTQPSDVANVHQTGATSSSVTIGWNRAEGATSYRVYQYNNGVYTLKGETTGTSFTISGLKNTASLPFTYLYVESVRSAGTYRAAGYKRGVSNFHIKLIPAKVKNVNIKYYWQSLKEINFGFNASVFYDGYQYQLWNINGKKALRTGETSSYYSTTLKNIKGYRFYKLRVRAYIIINGKKIYGQWSDFKGFAFQPKVKIKSSGRNLKLSWKKVKGAKSYTVYMSTSQKTGYKKVKTLKKTSYKVTKFKKKRLKRRKTYYIYVVANSKIGKKNVKSKAINCYYLLRR